MTYEQTYEYVKSLDETQAKARLVACMRTLRTISQMKSVEIASEVALSTLEKAQSLTV